MKKTLLTVAALALLAVPALAAEVPEKTIWGGGDPASSEYSGVYVPHLIKVFADNQMPGYSWLQPSPGTLHNALQVTRNPTNVALGQWDLLSDLNGKPVPGGAPGETYNFTVLAENIGPECLYLVTNLRGYDRPGAFGDFLANAWDLTIATGKEGSGSLGSFQKLQSIYPDIAPDATTVVEVGGAADIVAAVKSGQAQFGFFVQRPNPSNKVFEDIRSAGMTLVSVIDYELEGLSSTVTKVLPDGSTTTQEAPVYQFMNLKVENGGLFGGAKFHTTACTSVALITGSATHADPVTGAQVPRTDVALDTKQLKRIEQTIARIGRISEDSLRPNISGWADMWDSLTAMASDKAVEAMEASKVALEEARKQIDTAIDSVNR